MVFHSAVVDECGYAFTKSVLAEAVEALFMLFHQLCSLIYGKFHKFRTFYNIVGLFMKICRSFAWNRSKLVGSAVGLLLLRGLAFPSDFV